ncbi:MULTISPECIES: cell wall hydrolase [Pseudomonas]|uniref:Cell wall hydrolase n=1 Tax=Pseudomonas donghuensis TaxID=1163398 RepID=A0AAP0SIL7_9PSED|nr:MULTISPECIES: cell wall hydrolase [Pseudomonas]MDF9892972.1 spore germination cell wall hydrolase CwlJ-like protein [Pseudomonas vranovensis]KDN98812.1 cell wall hydrolase [Pseudomonas donghuensis]MCP6690912.1 cell wall hydrolase [Pseudomonas donghuensis]QHF28161.1 cell wall hydrolase [Pseudomonas sp. R32]UVL31457.1 cell wall hydrolase [Pseudomonas donghuensis]
MRLAILITCLALALLLADSAAAQNQAREAEEKAQVLEQKAASNPDAPPAPRSQAITRTEVQAVDPAGAAALDDAITCLARSIYWESKGGKAADMEAVANVVMNRVGHAGFPDSVCGVVKQGSEQGACQFSWWCDGRSDDVQEEVRYTLAKEIARKALNRQLPDRTGGALYFHDRHVRPDWSKSYARTAETREFLFYKPRKGKSH